MHYKGVRDPPGGATLCNKVTKVSKLAHYKHVYYTLALMCAKNHIITLGSFLDIRENAVASLFWPTL